MKWRTVKRQEIINHMSDGFYSASSQVWVASFLVNRINLYQNFKVWFHSLNADNSRAPKMHLWPQRKYPRLHKNLSSQRTWSLNIDTKTINKKQKIKCLNLCCCRGFDHSLLDCFGIRCVLVCQGVLHHIIHWCLGLPLCISWFHRRSHQNTWKKT